MQKHPLAEYFISIQGEAFWVGRRALFLRYTECNLNCSFCDTPQKAIQNYSLTVQDIQKTVEESNIKHLVVTGGEPFLRKDCLDEVLETFSTLTIEIETNGLLIPSLYELRPNVYLNVSPKVAFASLYSKEHLQYLASLPRTIFKFPVDKFSLSATLNFIDVMGLDSDRIYLMPLSRNYTEYVLNADTVLKEAIERGFNFSPRLHLIQNVK